MPEKVLQIALESDDTVLQETENMDRHSIKILYGRLWIFKKKKKKNYRNDENFHGKNLFHRKITGWVKME